MTRLSHHHCNRSVAGFFIAEESGPFIHHKSITMPIELGIWRLTPSHERITFIPIDKEVDLENAIVRDLSIIAPHLLLIRRDDRDGVRDLHRRAGG